MLYVLAVSYSIKAGREMGAPVHEEQKLVTFNVTTNRTVDNFKSGFHLTGLQNTLRTEFSPLD